MADGRDYVQPVGSGSDDPLGPGYKYTGPLAPGDQGKTPDQLNNELRQQQTNQPAAQSGGGGYTCDLGVLRSAVQQVNAMLDATNDDLYRARSIADVQPTAEDPDGSIMFANRLAKAGSDIMQVVQGQIDQLKAYKEHLTSVANNYAKMDDSTKISFNDIQREM